METKNKFYKDEMPHIVASSQVYGEVRSDSTAPMGANEASEVTTVMGDLVSVISRLHVSLDNLGLVLNPVLPEGYLERDPLETVKCNSEYLCPLARYIENEFKRINDLDDFVRNILSNIKL